MKECRVGSGHVNGHAVQMDDYMQMTARIGVSMGMRMCMSIQPALGTTRTCSRFSSHTFPEHRHHDRVAPLQTSYLSRLFAVPLSTRHFRQRKTKSARAVFTVFGQSHHRQSTYEGKMHLFGEDATQVGVGSGMDDFGRSWCGWRGWRDSGGASPQC
jgi:hypothetical protein